MSIVGFDPFSFFLFGGGGGLYITRAMGYSELGSVKGFINFWQNVIYRIVPFFLLMSVIFHST